MLWHTCAQKVATNGANIKIWYIISTTGASIKQNHLRYDKRKQQYKQIETFSTYKMFVEIEYKWEEIILIDISSIPSVDKKLSHSLLL